MCVDGVGFEDGADRFEVETKESAVWNGRTIEKLDEMSAPVILQAFMAEQKRVLSVEMRPFMVKIGVSHTSKDGEKTTVDVTVDTRGVSKPIPPPPPAPPSAPK